MVFIAQTLPMPVEQCKEKTYASDKIRLNGNVNCLRFRLMNIETLQWDTHLCNFFGVSKRLLPEIRSSSEVYGHFANGVLKVRSNSTTQIQSNVVYHRV